MNEVWFDTRTGEQLVNEADVAERLGQSDPGEVRPLRDVVLSRDFPYERKDFKKYDTSSLDQESVKRYGEWVIGMLSVDDRYNGLRRSHIERLGMLGVGPGRVAIRNHLAYGTFRDLRDMLGEPQEEMPHYDQWTRRDYAHYAHDLTVLLARKPTTDDFTFASQEGEGPSPWIMTHRMGTPAQINELNGFPNLHAWKTEEQFVSWGARAIDANHGAQLTARLLTVLSKRERGPSFGMIRDHFGSIGQFQQQARQRYETDPTSYAPRERVAGHRLAELASKRLINSWIIKYLNGQKLSAFVAKYELAHECLPDGDELEHAYMALGNVTGFTGKILAVRSDLCLEDLELGAIAQGHTDDIWPLSRRWRRHLLVTNTELGYKRTANRTKFGPPTTK